MQQNWGAQELVESWTLTRAERGIAHAKTGAESLCVAILTKFFALETRFPIEHAEVPPAAIKYVAAQLRASDTAVRSLVLTGEAAARHHDEVRALFGFRAAVVSDERRWSRWLAEAVAVSGVDRAELTTALRGRCRVEKVESPAPHDSDRLIHDAVRQCEREWSHLVADRLGEASALVDAVPGDELLTVLRTRWDPIDLATLATEIDTLTQVHTLNLSADWLAKVRAVPGPVELERLFQRIDTLFRLRSLELSSGLFDDVPRHVVEMWRDEADHTDLLSHSHALRLSRLAALCRTRWREITHELVEVLHSLVRTISTRLEDRLRREQDELLRCVDRTDRVLITLAHAVLDHPAAADEHVSVRNDGRGLTANGRHAEGGSANDHSPDDPVRAGGQRQDRRARVLQEVLNDARDSANWLRARQQRTVLRRTYSPAYRQVIAAIVAALEFRCDHPERWPILLALGELLDDRTSSWGKSRFYDTDRTIPIAGVVPDPWRRAVVDERGRVERVPYELTVLISLDKALGRREIEVTAAGERTPTPFSNSEPPARTEPASDHGRSGQALIAWPTADERRPITGGHQ